MSLKDFFVGGQVIKGITRVEVITDKGREFVSWDDKNEVTLNIQNDGKTLKVFIQQQPDIDYLKAAFDAE